MERDWFSFSDLTKQDILYDAASNSGRKPHIIEKDIYVTWALSQIVQPHLANKLTFDILRAVNGEDSYGATHELPLA